MRIFVFLEADITIRHFISSKAFSLLERKHDIKYVFPMGHKRLGKINPHDLNIRKEQIIDIPSHEKRLSLWRMKFFVERLRHQKSISKNQRQMFHKLFKSTNPLKLYFVYRFFGLVGVFDIFTLITNLILKNNPYHTLDILLKNYNPDLIIHPCVLEGVYVNDLVKMGSERKIPTILIMNSWDNPASKRTVISNDFWLLVWGPQTKKHAISFMRMRSERVFEFGAAQFDIYLEKPNKSKLEIFKSHDFVRDKRLLLYAGSSKLTNEFDHLSRIDDAISSGFLPPTNVIYRPHPWGEGGLDGTRFLNHDFKNVKVDKSMFYYLELIRKGDKKKEMANYEDTRNLLSAVDAIISPLSTILIEGMILGKPVLCYMPIDEGNDDHFKSSLKQTHFEEFLSIPEVLVAWGGDQLLELTSELIKKTNNLSYSKDVKKASEFIIKPFKKPFRERIVSFVEDIYKEANK
tara:strand:+ start:3960 stop:5342 length:1383 start_codon:yes stop_codon:yes gene_type:complete